MQLNEPKVEKDKPAKTALNYDFSMTDDHASGGKSGGHGNGDGWLVSYADMMTLLFGLFVLMYALASEKTGNVEQNMKEISDKYFSETTVEKKVKPVAKAISTIDPKLVAQMQAEIEKLKKLQNPDQRQLIAQLQAEIELLKKSQNPDQRRLVADLQVEIEKLKKLQNPDQSQLVAEMKAEIEKLKKLQNPNQRALVKQLQDEIAQLKKIPDQRLQVADLNQKVDELKAKVQERKIASVDEKKFMIITTTWTTEKHDVDLVVKDPDGFTYTFKNRRSPQSIGALEIDSRFGPGLELWRTANLKPGKYQVLVKLYNQAGNTKDAEIRTQIVTKSANLELPPLKLNLENREQKYNLVVNEEGLVTIE